VPLSEEELRMLEQMERALVEEDPKLASTLRGTNLRRKARRRVALAGFCFAAGLAILMAGAVSRFTLVGLLGFVIMLSAATTGLAALRGQHHPPHVRSTTSLVERAESRWRRRRHDDA